MAVWECAMCFCIIKQRACKKSNFLINQQKTDAASDLLGQRLVAKELSIFLRSWKCQKQASMNRQTVLIPSYHTLIPTVKLHEFRHGP